jgi:hypothetical protein
MWSRGIKDWFGPYGRDAELTVLYDGGKTRESRKGVVFF